MGLLAAGAGAAHGFERTLQRWLQEDELARRQKNTEADLGLRRDTLNENTKYRQLQQEQLNDDRKLRDFDRDTGLVDAQTKMLNTGDVIPQADYERMRTHGIPSARFKQSETAAPMPNPSDEGPNRATEQRWIRPDPTATSNTPTTRFQSKNLIIDGKGAPQPVDFDPIARKYYKGQTEIDPQRLSAPEPLSQTQDANGNIILQPRSGAAGGRGVDPAAQRTEMDELSEIDRMGNEILARGKATNWAGVGPVTGTIGAAAHEFGADKLPIIRSMTGGDTGGGDEGTRLRALITNFTTSYAFGKGGKQLTPAEREALDAFSASVNKDPKTAEVKLSELLNQLRPRRQQLTTGQPQPARVGATDDDPLGLNQP